MNGVLAVAGLAAVAGGWIEYLARIPAERVPPRPVAHILAMVAGLALAAAAVIRPLPAVELTAVGLATVSTVLAGLFFYLLSIARMPDGSLVVSVGDPLPTFAAPAHDGTVLKTEDLRGGRVLLKFFRGHW